MTSNSPTEKRHAIITLSTVPPSSGFSLLFKHFESIKYNSHSVHNKNASSKIFDLIILSEIYECILLNKSLPAGYYCITGRSPATFVLFHSSLNNSKYSWNSFCEHIKQKSPLQRKQHQPPLGECENLSPGSNKSPCASNGLINTSLKSRLRRRLLPELLILATWPLPGMAIR